MRTRAGWWSRRESRDSPPSSTSCSPITTPEVGSMMMSVLATPSGEGMPMAIPVLPSTFACLSPTVTPGVRAAALYRAARRSAGTTPLRGPSAIATNASLSGTSRSPSSVRRWCPAGPVDPWQTAGFLDGRADDKPPQWLTRSQRRATDPAYAPRTIGGYLNFRESLTLQSKRLATTAHHDRAGTR